MSLEKHVVLFRARINTRKEKGKSGCSFVDANSYTLTTTNCLFSGFHGKWSKAYHSAQDKSSPLHIYLATIYCQQASKTLQQDLPMLLYACQYTSLCSECYKTSTKGHILNPQQTTSSIDKPRFASGDMEQKSHVSWLPVQVDKQGCLVEFNKASQDFLVPSSICWVPYLLAAVRGTRHCRHHQCLPQRRFPVRDWNADFLYEKAKATFRLRNKIIDRIPPYTVKSLMIVCKST